MVAQEPFPGQIGYTRPMPETEIRAPVMGRRDPDGLFWIRFDDPDRPVNVLSDAAMQALEEVLRAAAEPGLRGVVLASGKPGVFLAGADIKLFETVRTAAEGAELARRGRNIFQKLADLPVPTVALVSGACLGGGLELALSCDWRVAADDSKTRLGLPEVQLGIIPGLGGTQRLPRLVGIPAALDLILTGRTLAGRKAEKLGLVDEACPPEILERRAAAWVARGKRPAGRSRAGLLSRWPLAKIPLSIARRKTIEKTGGRYPAPEAAIDAVGTGLSRGIAAGFAREAELFGQLAVTDVSRNLVRLFFLKERFSKPPDGARSGKSFRKAGVVGAGIMGGGIAHLAAGKGMRVRLKDIAPEPLAKALSVVRDLDRKRAKGSPEERLRARDTAARVLPTLDDTGFGDTDVVIEAVVESLPLKQKVFSDLERVVAPGTILATNTSSLPITRIAEKLARPERAVGIHFFNPVHKMPLVEVIPGEKTSAQVVKDAVSLVLALGKVPVVVADRPGFLVNRILLPYVGEAVRCWTDGAETEQVDSWLRRFGMPMGPLELADAVGIDVGIKVAHVLEEAFGDRMAVPPLLLEMEKRKWLGTKTGFGFYAYRGTRKGDANGALPALRTGTLRIPTEEEVVDRCILTMVNEAARCLSEKVVESPEALDLAMVFGTGFAPFTGGLWSYAQARGLSACRARLADLAARLGPRFTPASSLG